MTTAVDTNVFVALLRGTAEDARMSRQALTRANDVGALVISPPVFAELAAAPGGNTRSLDEFLQLAEVTVDWVMDEEVWRESMARGRPRIQGVCRTPQNPARRSRSPKNPR